MKNTDICKSMDSPLKLEPTRAWRSYKGGKMLDILHGAANPADSHFPEEWIISTVAARNPGREEFAGEGLSRLAGAETLLASLIEEYPAEMLGDRHIKAVGETTGVLVKLLDAADRLTIQVHPDKEHAMKLLGSRFGKTECWHILSGRNIDGERPHVYLGFKPGITRERWESLFKTQDVGEMLDCLNKFYVKPGETYLVEGGVPHAIGAGCFMVEIQEPTDYTIRFERVTPSGVRNTDEMCHLGMGFDAMLDCFSYEGLTAAQALKRWRIAGRGHEVVGYADTPCFRLLSSEIHAGGHFAIDGQDGVFSGLYILDGTGYMEWAGNTGTGLIISRGDQFFIPAAADGYSITNTGSGTMKILRFFGPDTKASVYGSKVVQSKGKHS